MSRKSKTPGVRRLPSGSWRAEIMVGTKRLGETFPTEVEAAKWRADQAVKRVRGGEIARGGAMTFGEWWEEFDLIKRDPTTAAKHRAWWSSRIKRRWGRTAMRSVSHVQLERWADELAEELAESTIRTVLYVVSAMYREAIHARKLDANPVLTMRERPALAETVKRVLDDDEIDAILAAAPDEVTRALVIVMRDAGVRPGEAFGIKARNVRADRIILNQRIDRTTGKPKPGLKGKGARAHALTRDVPLTAWMREAIEPLLVGKSGDDLVFTTSTGKPIHPHNWYARKWRPMVEAANLADPQPKPYDLRRTCATVLGKSGVVAQDLRDLLGHSDDRSLTEYLVTDSALPVQLAALADERRAKRTRSAVHAVA